MSGRKKVRERKYEARLAALYRRAAAAGSVHLTESEKQRFHLRMPMIDRVSEQDRSWFAAHPEANEYVRPYIPGEFGIEKDAEMSAIEYTLVTQVFPGFRTRQRVMQNSSFDDAIGLLRRAPQPGEEI
jgi:hypothetical protein